ncbi:MAG: MotA/TolQ/ExbB proton channel family protein [Proteobacteria bacterium]|nr:MotA/TolQ/ExbB proton channel family protein [Pseudomonadota bacterium]MCZ6784090.1 MotA/TolQ/ExbB proton channel family protein [Pseudomonadota bacterium]
MDVNAAALSEALSSLAGRGGPVLVILLGLSVLALTLVLLKLYQFARLRLWSRAWLEPVLAAVGVGEAERAITLAEASPNPTARVVVAAVRAKIDPGLSETGVREEVERVAIRELGALEANLRGLETIGTLAPLLGLLGTVLGMIRAFMRLEEAGSRVDPALLSGGIWEALLTTAVGLAVAIPTMAMLAWLESQIDRLRRAMGDAATQVLNASRLTSPAGPGPAPAPSDRRTSALAREPQHAL